MNELNDGMTSTLSLHSERMWALVEFTATSFETAYPSPFGAAVYEVESGALIAQAYDTVLRQCDPTNHGEVNAIRLATQQTGQLSLRGCVMYSTCEPCPMCMSACIWAELDMVVFGASTTEDASRYWPQASDISPSELVERMQFEPKCKLLPHIERARCQELFARCDDERQKRQLQLPPHR